MKKNKTCTLCINDTTVKDIKFNQDGLCNYCETYQREYHKWHDFDALEEIFHQKINNVLLNKTYKYDVCIPFSGGKDSTYVLYKMANYIPKLRICSFTLDNGFLSDEAKLRINQIVKELNIPHEYVQIDEKLIKRIYHEIVGKYLSPCIACSYMGYALMINYASYINAGLIIHGRSRAQMFRHYASDVNDTFKPFLDNAFTFLNSDELEKLYQNVLGKVNKYIDKNLSKDMENALLKDTKEKGFREFIGYFIYHDYDLNEVVNTISINTSWKAKFNKLSDIEHFDCLIHNGAKYIKDIIAKRPHDLPELSFMVRDQKLSRIDALKIIEKEKEEHNQNSSTVNNELNIMCKYMNLNKKFLITKAKIYAKRWW